MSELTTAYLDKKFAEINNRIKDQTKELKDHSEKQTESLARIVAETVATPMEQRFKKLERLLDTDERVTKIEEELEKIKKALLLSDKDFKVSFNS